MGRKTNKTKFVESCFYYIEHSQDTKVKSLYFYLLKEKVDEYIKDYKLLLYDYIKDSLLKLYDVYQRLHMVDEKHNNSKEAVDMVVDMVLDSSYFQGYLKALDEETVINQSWEDWEKE